MKEQNDFTLNRRRFNKLFTAAAVGGPLFLTAKGSGAKPRPSRRNWFTAMNGRL